MFDYKTLLRLAGALLIQALIFVPFFPPLMCLTIPGVWFFTFSIYQSEKSRSDQQQFMFRKNRPFFPFGSVISEHSFPFLEAARCADHVVGVVEQVGILTPNTRLQRLQITDKAPPQPYSKPFYRISTETPLKTEVSFIFNITTITDALYLRWWVLVQGRVKPSDVFWFVLFSPIFSFAFWIIPWFQKEYSVLAAIAGDIEHTYDVLDINAWVTVFQQTTFNTLLEELEKQGINVDAYKDNPPVLNVTNISGSGNVIGAIAQGQRSSASGNVQQRSAA
jgi:hypothetical protein